MLNAVQHRHLVLHPMAHPVAQQSPILIRLGGAFNFHAHLPSAVLIQMQTPSWNTAGQHGRAGALTPLGVGTRPQHRIGIDHGRRFHPRTVLAKGWHIAHLIRCAGVDHVHAHAGHHRFAAPVKLHGFFADTHFFGVVRIETQLQVKTLGPHLRHFHHIRRVQVEFAEHRVKAALGHGEVAHEGRRGGDRAANIAGFHKISCTQGVAIANQQVHGFGHGRAIAPVAHGFFVVGELHAHACTC